ncbi:MAG: leucine--tRNA ligase [bacterium]|nr:leucine--tRNA ligase [bacterium]
MKYDHKTIEEKWQGVWEKNWHELYGADDASSKPKYYLLVEFPYPSGEGLHMGHPRPYTGLDIIARKRRMEGFNVLYPIGWDAFGLPAENYAIKTGQHPRVTTQNNINNFRRQMKSLGISFDWDREVDTTDPKYYRWTQWMFLKFYQHGLAYKAKIPINWCPKDKIGLANEEVIGGNCERCGTPVEKRDKEQWMIRITKYADRLIDDLKTVDYWDKIKQQQIDWIGRSEGAEITFHLTGMPSSAEATFASIAVFTTRPDTLFGATYMVLAPEHPFANSAVDKKLLKNTDDVARYIADAKKKSEIDRTAEGKEKTGVELKGVKAINPANGKEIPVFVADYVLGGYGTGAIMAVPAHDARDFAFAKKYQMPIEYVVARKDNERTSDEVFEEEGIAINSDFLNKLPTWKAKADMISWLEEKGVGKKATTYKLRDWVFSRQRYWGEPIPMIHCPSCGIVPVPENQLPVLLPEVEKYQPTDTGESPLATIADWVNVSCPQCKGAAKRETDVMPNWAGSSWYFLRYIDPKNNEAFASREKLKYWMPIDWYNGGMEHTTLHLLYSRFWNKFLFDIGLVPTAEPYKKRTSHGLILAEDGEKMSKSRGNVINPDSVVEESGADTLRLYEMFIGPFDQPVPWNTQGVIGVCRFLERVFDVSVKCQASSVKNVELERIVHKTVKKVTEDIEVLKFNTAVSQMMICVKAFQDADDVPQELFELFLKVFSPFAPHMAEELWNRLGHKESITKEVWPIYDPELARDAEIELVVQVNGKVRDRIAIAADVSEEELKAAALGSEKIQVLIHGKSIKQIIVARGKLVNVVVE